MLIFILLIINIPIYLFLFKLLFEDREEFYEAIRYGFIPDFISFIRGDLDRDWFLTFKMAALIWGSIGIVAIEYFLISSIFYK